MSEQFFADFYGAWNSHDGQKLEELMATDGVYEDVATGRVMDPAATAEFVGTTSAMSSDYVIDIVSTQLAGNSYSTEWVMSGTQDGPAPEIGLPATGKPWKIRGVSVGTLDDAGKIKHNTDYWNLAEFLMQLGAMPAPSGAGAEAPAG